MRVYFGGFFLFGIPIFNQIMYSAIKRNSKTKYTISYHKNKHLENVLNFTSICILRIRDIDLSFSIYILILPNTVL